jgi:hypothetical protein
LPECGRCQRGDAASDRQPDRRNTMNGAHFFLTLRVLTEPSARLHTGQTAGVAVTPILV